MMDKEMGRRMAGFEGKATINRKEWNILWNRTLDQGATMLGDDVNIKLQVEGFWRDPSAQPPPMGEKK
jgi:polyisoprenoid-binding protein YceI